MTLVVANITDGKITAVCDTKLTYEGDEARNRHVYEEARPKLFILRPNLFVGVAGDDFMGTCRMMAEVRDRPVDEVIAKAVSVTSSTREVREVIVGADGPTRLWHVKNGSAFDVTGFGRAWIGDVTAYNRFSALERPSDPPGLALQAPMQSLATLGGIAGVGGVIVRVDQCEHGFGFSATPMEMHEPISNATMTSSAEGALKLSFTVELAPLRVHVLTGLDPTRGAIAFHFDGSGYGYVYPDGQPWDVRQVDAVDCSTLIAEAAQSGQFLGAEPGCPARAS